LQAEQALEQLDRYPQEPEVHKYLHSRMMAFDISTLYELHYTMITLGKVFCHKVGARALVAGRRWGAHWW
jgi:hypothetical protein